MVRNVFGAFFASPFVFIYAIWVIYNASHMLSDEEKGKMIAVLLVILAPLAPFLLISITQGYLDLNFFGFTWQQRSF